MDSIFFQEEEGDEVTSSHRFPPGAYPQNYNSRYADNTYGGPAPMRDAHEENPESILDDHVRRVMKTPGCQSPGTGRHSPKSRSPDDVPGSKGTAASAAPGKHPSRHGPKGDGGHLYHHKHEAGQYGSKSRSYADGVGSNPAEHAGYGSASATRSLPLSHNAPPKMSFSNRQLFPLHRPQ